MPILLREQIKVLFICTGNSGRSILAEYLLKRMGAGRFEVDSAGTEPAGTVNPFTLRVLRDLYDIDASDARSKSCDEFKHADFDFVITVCDHARESCPVWPGQQPILAHWSGVPAPGIAAGTEDDILEAFRSAAVKLERRIELFCALPFEKLDRPQVEQLTRALGS